MILTSDNVEFRRLRSQERDGKMNYYYTFEDDNGSFEVWTQNQLPEVKKGQLVTLQYETHVFQGKMSFRLVGIISKG